MKKALGQVIFPNYEKYSNINKAYNDFFHKLIEVVNKIAPLKTVRKKNASSEWFDREIAEKLSLRDKLFKKFKSSRLNIGWEIYKEARNDVQRLIKYKKKKYFDKKADRKYSKIKKALADVKITRITKQKDFTVKHMLRK